MFNSWVAERMRPALTEAPDPAAAEQGTPAAELADEAGAQGQEAFNPWVDARMQP